MTVYGFCTAEQADVPISSERRCLTDGSLCIPPSWGRQTQTWNGADWVPARARPEGYVWTPPEPVKTMVAPVVSVTATCANCRETFERSRVAGIKQMYCSDACKTQLQQVRKEERQKAAAARKRVRVSGPIATMTCERCGGAVPPTGHHGGKPRRFCSKVCAHAHYYTNTPRPTMAERGMVCRECGRGDRHHHRDGLCTACSRRARRAEIREAS